MKSSCAHVKSRVAASRISSVGGVVLGTTTRTATSDSTSTSTSNYLEKNERLFRERFSTTETIFSSFSPLNLVDLKKAQNQLVVKTNSE